MVHLHIYLILRTNFIIMSDKAFVYIIITVVIAHFIFAVGYLIWKVYSAPKSSDEIEEFKDLKNKK